MAFDLLDSAPGQDKFSDAYPKINVAIEASDNISFSGVLATKVVQIGDWNMDSSVSVNVAHGIADYKKIRSIGSIIREDSDVGYYSLGYINSAAADGFGVSNITTTNIQLARVDSGAFDNTNFDSTTFNRGWITITYEV